jgi:hypothetical protein
MGNGDVLVAVRRCGAGAGGGGRAAFGAVAVWLAVLVSAIPVAAVAGGVVKAAPASRGSLRLGQAPVAASRCPRAKTVTGFADPRAGSQPVRAIFKPRPVRVRPPRSAKAFARKVLGEAVVPPGSVRTAISPRSILAAPVATPAVKGLTDIYHAYKVARPESIVLAYEKTHLPRGARLAGIGRNCRGTAVFHFILLSVPVAGSHEYSATLAIGIAPSGAHSSLLRVDAQVVWVASRPTLEKAQASALLRLTIYRSNQLGGNITVTLRGTQEREVTGRLNSFPLGAPSECAERDPLYQLDYVSPSSSFRATGYGCAGTILVAVNGRTAAPLHDGNLRLVHLMDSLLPAHLKVSRNNSAGGWAGWVNVSPPNPPGQYESAFANWTVPTVNCDPFEMAGASEWVGIDGFGGSTVEQAGTQSDCVLGQGTYAAWWELFGTPVDGGSQVDLPGDDHIHPGDHVSVTVVAGHGSGNPGLFFPGEGTYLFTFVNFTEHWSYQAIQPTQGALKPSPPNLTTEWIVEQPSCFWACQALANYGEVSFTGMFLSLNSFDYPFGPVFPPGDTTPPGPFPGHAVSLVTDGTLKETGSSLAGGNKEVVTFVHK